MGLWLSNNSELEVGSGTVTDLSVSFPQDCTVDEGYEYIYKVAVRLLLNGKTQVQGPVASFSACGGLVVTDRLFRPMKKLLPIRVSKGDKLRAEFILAGGVLQHNASLDRLVLVADYHEELS